MPPTKRHEAPRTVTGQDIELLASDGQRVNTAAQAPFTRAMPPAGTYAGPLTAEEIVAIARKYGLPVAVVQAAYQQFQAGKPLSQLGGR